MIRVVVEANVYISALIFGGIPQQALDLISSRDLRLYISQSIVDEVTGTLLEKFGWGHGDVGTFLPPLWERCVVIKPNIRVKVCSDPDDDRVMECAEAARADFLIAGNTKHFPRSHKNTKIIRPRQFLELFQPEAG